MPALDLMPVMPSGVRLSAWVSPGCEAVGSSELSELSELSDHCRTTVGPLSDDTVGPLSDHCRTTLSDHCRTTVGPLSGAVGSA